MFEIASNQKHLILQIRFHLDSSFAFAKAILYECHRSRKFENLYSSFLYIMSKDAVYFLDCAMFLSG